MDGFEQVGRGGGGLSWYEVRKRPIWHRCIHRWLLETRQDSLTIPSILQWNKAESMTGKEKEEGTFEGREGGKWQPRKVGVSGLPMGWCWGWAWQWGGGWQCCCTWDWWLLCDVSFGQDKFTWMANLWLANQLMEDVVKHMRVYVMDSWYSWLFHILTPFCGVSR